MLQFLKATWILFWAALLTLLLFFPIVIAALLGKRGDAAFHGTQVFAWTILKVTGIRLVVTGRENIVPGQRYVILSNHASYFDPPALVLALGLQYRWVIKKELRKVPLFGLALETKPVYRPLKRQCCPGEYQAGRRPVAGWHRNTAVSGRHAFAGWSLVTLQERRIRDCQGRGIADPPGDDPGFPRSTAQRHSGVQSWRY